MLEITLEQVEKVRAYAKVSMEEAKAALEQAGGSPLDAVILLERQGKTATVPGGCCTTRPGASPDPACAQNFAPPALPLRTRRPVTGREVGRAIRDLLRNITSVYLEVWRREELMVAIPILALVALVIIVPYVMLPLAALGLCMRCRYRFTGAELEHTGVNDAMAQVSDKVADWTDQVKRDFRTKNRG